ncbi:MAG: FAD-dependent oxidoreductase [Burkholderiales bacterium]|nr:FAD-dependent oxidoreductase [Burkholderiales bacterium]
MKPIVIIGAGLAGYTVARELRKLDQQTPLTLVTADDGAFYAKPTLSNAFALAKRADQLINQSAAQMASQLKATILTSARAREIDARHKTVVVDGKSLSFSKLVLAVGAQAIQLPIEGDAADQILSINHLQDYARFHEKLAAVKHNGAKRVAILGAGLIGCEFANDLARAGHAVTLIDPNALPLGALAPAALSQGLMAALQKEGVVMRLKNIAERVDVEGDALQVSLSDGSTLIADIVLSAVGLRPSVTLAHTAQLKVGRGIQVDAFGQTSEEDIYALGDCAEYAQPNGTSRMLPYVAPLMGAARAIGRTLGGQVTAIDWQPAPVIVKTPCFPLALIPPPPACPGQWQVTTENDKTVCRYLGANGVIHGFGVAPQDAASRQALAREIGTSLLAAQ